MEDNERAITSRQDTVLLGRGMYDEWSRFWPTAAGEPFVDFINAVDKHVLTSSPLTYGWRNARAVAAPLADVVADLTGGPGGDIGVHGSIRLARSLLAADLVDELRLVVAPAYGFPGRRLLEGLGSRRPQLLDTVATPMGSLLLHYRLRDASRPISDSAR
ncbi:MAG: Bifunctional deaminase-reductase domain protein [Frankiales bacterium]|jgi:dihydrofolate reductase|nr:Bifunctional deaminase-reductase domain protein [Frankiales bacterium]